MKHPLDLQGQFVDGLEGHGPVLSGERRLGKSDGERGGGSHSTTDGERALQLYPPARSREYLCERLIKTRIGEGGLIEAGRAFVSSVSVTVMPRSTAMANRDGRRRRRVRPSG